MRASTLLQFVETLTAAERGDLRAWLASPFFNTRADVRALFEHLLHGLDRRPEQLRKEAAFAAIYPTLPYDERRLNRTMSELLGQVRDYLAWQESQADPAAGRLLRCRALRKRGLHDAFAKELEQTRALLEAQPWRDEQWHGWQHQLCREQYELAALQSRRADLPLEDMAAHAETAYRLNRLRYDCSAEVLRAVSGRQAAAPPVFSPELPAVNLYEQLLTALREPAREEAFLSAKKLLELHWACFREEERRGLYLLALNYCIRKTNSGQRQFMREALDLYQSGLANRALFENGMLSRFTYKNAVTAGLALGEMAWARQFIEDYKAFLPARERHGAYSYNLAVWYFRLPDYEEAMRLLRDTDFGQDALTNLDARAMLMRIYYEHGYADALESLLDSFQTYLRRQKDIGYQRDNYLNLLRFTRKLLRLPDGESKAALRREIQDTAALAERAWLLERCG